MPFVYRDFASLPIRKELAGSGTCVDLIKVYVPGLQGVPTSAWRAGVNVMEAGSKVVPGTAIATFEKGRYPGRDHDNHAAIVVLVMPSGIWVIDQWKGDARRPYMDKRLIRIPAPRMQRNADGSFRTPSDNALAFYVIER